jgi:hypothetical protein
VDGQVNLQLLGILVGRDGVGRVGYLDRVEILDHLGGVDGVECQVNLQLLGILDGVDGLVQ